MLASVFASVATVGGGYLVARRFQKLGGNEAQDRLNKIRADLDEAMQDKLRVLGDDFAGCKTRLVEVESTVERMRRERIDLKQEIGDLHRELRKLRVDRKGALDRTDD